MDATCIVSGFPPKTREHTDRIATTAFNTFTRRRRIDSIRIVCNVFVVYGPFFYGVCSKCVMYNSQYIERRHTSRKLERDFDKELVKRENIHFHYQI